MREAAEFRRIVRRGDVSRRISIDLAAPRPHCWQPALQACALAEQMLNPPLCGSDALT